MRIFLAIDLPSHVKSRIFHKFEVLSKKNLFRGKAVKKDNLHLTLKFFGNLSNKQVDDITKKLNSLSFDKLSCSIGKVGVFDNENNIKVIWFEFVGDGLSDLNHKINLLFPEFSKGDKSFTPHITAARVNQTTNRQELLKELRTLQFKNLNFVADELVLMKSILTPKGPNYKVLEKFRLG